MNKKYYDRVNSFNIYKAQDRALKKAQELDLPLSPSAYEKNIFPEDSIINMSDLTRFADDYFSLFGDNAPDYIYSLLHPFSPDHWYIAEYFPISESIPLDEQFFVDYGLEQTIGNVMLDVKLFNFTFSDIKILKDGAKFYISGELFATIKKIDFSNQSPTLVKEITSALKGANALSDGGKLNTQTAKSRLSKVTGFSGYQGHALNGEDGHFVHSSISNFVKGFQRLLSEFSDEKIPLNKAEKVMWAFFDINNEHILRANEKLNAVTSTLFITSTRNNDTGIHSDFEIYHNLPSSLAGFTKQLLHKNQTNSPFNIQTGIWPYRGLVSVDIESEETLKVYAHDIASQEYSENCINEAKKLFSGEVKFSSRKDYFLESFTAGGVEISLYKINDELHVTNDCDEIIPVSSLLFHAYRSDVWRVDANYNGEYEKPDFSKNPIEWHLSRQKYERPTISFFKFGQLTLNEISLVVKKLSLPASNLSLIMNKEERYSIHAINELHGFYD